jgi:hypothetical protein
MTRYPAAQGRQNLAAGVSFEVALFGPLSPVHLPRETYEVC